MPSQLGLVITLRIFLREVEHGHWQLGSWQQHVQGSLVDLPYPLGSH